MLTATNFTPNKVEVSEASKDWYQWCRLCANDDIQQHVNIFLKHEYTSTADSTEQLELQLSDAIGKYFYVEISNHDEQLPKQLCTQCFALVTSMVDFTKRVAKVQQMYIEMQSAPITTEKDTQYLRIKHGIWRDYRALDMLATSLEHAQRLFEAHHEQVSKAQDKNFNVEIGNMVTIPLQKSTHSALYIKEEDNMTDIILEANDDICDFQNDDLGQLEDPFASDDEGNNEEILQQQQQKRCNNEIDVKTSKISKKISVKKAKTEQKEGEETSKKTNTFKKPRAPEPAEYNFFCEECSLKFRRIGSYRLHLHRKHGIPLPTLTCAQCSKIFKTEYELKKHINIHRPTSEKNIFPCPQCDRKFQNKDYVATHIKFVHEDIRPFVCDECGEAVRTESALREHMLTHSDYAAFECVICKKCFKNRPRLKKHMETHSANKHTCDECGLQLNSRATLNLHKLVHSDEMPHKCDYCGRAFKRAKTLKSHLILHSGLKPYSCNFCDKKFANGPNCRTHKLKSHPKELAALEAAGEKAYTKNIPKLSVLKAVTRTVENLTPVVSKGSGGQKKLIDKSSKSLNVKTTVTVPPTCL
ncbi:zinc finger protein weckle-like isoform X2 [Eurosta solidaginis]|uniref:zinc finger protein weckle-like isoform X2 n=1 Tax=Eurosta solidaginis TaxID=178769 RepID=UPI003531068E